MSLAEACRRARDGNADPVSFSGLIAAKTAFVDAIGSGELDEEKFIVACRDHAHISPAVVAAQIVDAVDALMLCDDEDDEFHAKASRLLAWRDAMLDTESALAIAMVGKLDRAVQRSEFRRAFDAPKRGRE